MSLDLESALAAQMAADAQVWRARVLADCYSGEPYKPRGRPAYLTDAERERRKRARREREKERRKARRKAQRETAAVARRYGAQGAGHEAGR